MLKRKMEKVLQDWKNNPCHKPLVIKGCRQCGKTSPVLAFAKKEYKNVVYLNFLENKQFNAIFADSLEIDYLTMMLSSYLQAKAVFKPHETILIMDEIQACPEARTSLKFFHLDGRYDVIATGSLMGVSGYTSLPRSVPVGYEQTVNMYPLDFEEFLWASGVDENLIHLLQQCLEKERPVPATLHQRMRELLLQ